ncbi:molybdopterin-guanine dinucleotide biosynthesis protein MobB [Desulforhopalus vacuolatus]|uniref:molybdopterin-guanine dinucleotide biosynthesis protein B n=1 Tax=Desulforhopalus vacuolatus TaxID=40414 RepID=UPI001963E4AA|nr:molybdopterin-guanine dinucleotide biosynthesis protein MobB [Desulforhopalus vacuolatus]MBM9520452.1 molybdopterin-guanine dinucleotide biosynthesis protein MobB [Desulforhopalus vacuolatus]
MSSSPVIVTFIGWHDSGKTTLASRVVVEMLRRGRRVAVVKSTKERGITFDSADTDSGIFRATGAPVLLAAPEEIFLQQPMAKLTLRQLASRYFNDMELVVGEGFKEERDVVKIEVCRGGERLAGKVTGVAAVVGAVSLCGERAFSVEDVEGIADFIEEQKGR